MIRDLDEKSRVWACILYVPEDFEGWDESLAQLLMFTTNVTVVFY